MGSSSPSCFLPSFLNIIHCRMSNGYTGQRPFFEACLNLFGSGPFHASPLSRLCLAVTAWPFAIGGVHQCRWILREMRECLMTLTMVSFVQGSHEVCMCLSLASIYEVCT